MRTASNKNLEDAVFKWFLQQRSLGNPLSGPCVCEKAKMFAEKMSGLSKFKPCVTQPLRYRYGWLRNFKARHGIRAVSYTHLDVYKRQDQFLRADKCLTRFY